MRLKETDGSLRLVKRERERSKDCTGKVVVIWRRTGMGIES